MFDSVFSVITIVAVVAVFVFFFFVKKKEGKDWIYAVYFTTALITGIVLYGCGLAYKNDIDTAFSPLFILMKAITSSLKAFGGDFQLSSISALAQDNMFVHIAIFVHFIGSLILTYLVAVKLFGKNIINRLRVLRNSFLKKHIVVGGTKQAKLFLNSFDRKDRKRTTVILEPEQAGLKRDFMDNGFAVVVIKEGTLAVKRPSCAGSRYLQDEMCAALTKAGYHRNTQETKVISMSESDEMNLLVAKIVTDRIRELIGPEKDSNGRVARLTAEQETKLDGIKLSAHIMYGSIERAQHFAFSDYALGRVNFFNPYEMRARKFILENPITSLIPDEWINTKTARLFNKDDSGKGRAYRIGNVFVGYGKANQQLLKKSICSYQLLGADYNALILDKDARRLESQFKNVSPGLFRSRGADGSYVNGAELLPNPDGSVYYPDPEEKYSIKFDDLDVLSSDFYNRIVREISGEDDKSNSVGYDFVSVIIALGNDKLSVETALELRQKLHEKKLLFWGSGDGKKPRVRIFVKIKKETVLSDYDLINDKNDIGSEITVFGASHEVLTEDYIVHEQLDVVAKRIANDYWQNAGSHTQTTNAISKWDTLTEFKRNSNRYAAMAIRTKLELLGFTLVETANENDQTDDDTKRAYEAAYGTARANKLRGDKQSKKDEFIDFVERTGDKIADNARNNLARLEHQRWNTIHLLSGWTKLPVSEVTAANGRQDELSKKHACITTFEGLNDLRLRQAQEAVAKAKSEGADLPLNEALSKADTVCYDFDVMDRLFENLSGSKYKVIKRKQNNPQLSAK